MRKFTYLPKKKRLINKMERNEMMFDVELISVINEKIYGYEKRNREKMK